MLADDSYTPSGLASQATSLLSASEAGAQNQSNAQSSIALQATELLSESSSSQGGSSEQGGPMASALTAAEQDGIAVAQWMEEQAAMSAPSQAASSAAGDLMSQGASLVAKFSNDLNELGSIIGQTASNVTGGLQAQSYSSSAVNSETNDLQSSLTLDAIDALGNAIGTAINGAGGNFSFGFSDTALSPGSSPLDALSQLSLHISNYNQPSSAVNSAQPYDFSLVFDSTSSSAAVSEASSSATSDGSVTATAVAAESTVEQYTMNTTSMVQTAAGQSTLTTAAMSGTISNTVGIGVSETTDGSSSNQTAVEIDTSSESDNLLMASTTVNAAPSGNTDAALMTSWNRALGLSTWGAWPAAGSPAKAELAILAGIDGSQNSAGLTASEPWKMGAATATSGGSETPSGSGDHRIDVYA